MEEAIYTKEEILTVVKGILQNHLADALTDDLIGEIGAQLDVYNAMKDQELANEYD